MRMATFSGRSPSSNSRAGHPRRKSPRRDVLSSDQVTWIKAPMLQELGMDWLVELTSERYYGPTTLGAVQEFIRLGEINGETFVINSCDGTRRQIQEMPELLQSQIYE